MLLDAASVKNKPAVPPNKDMAAPQVSGGTTGDATADVATFLEESGSVLPTHVSFNFNFAAWKARPVSGIYLGAVLI